MKAIRIILTGILLCLFSVPVVSAAELAKLERRLENCDEVLNEVLQMPDKTIPADLLSKCAAVCVFPYVIKGGFFVGARYGKGVVIAHDPDTGTWQSPAFFTIGGGSFGFQFGAQAVDLILVVMNKRGLESLLKNRFTLGGDIAVVAGPVGRVASADTDLLFKAGVLSYSRSKGIFAGVALKGAVVAPDDEANHAYYSGPVGAREIILGERIVPPATAKPIIETLKRFSK
ncbi:lipid-binding SYLF domain-containing protein [Candidatus Omnitrophota bacterium]